MLLAHGNAYADPFNCDGDIFQVQSGQLRIFDPITSSYVDVGPQNGSYNATGYNVLDNYAYGMQGQDVIRVHGDGTIEDVFTNIGFGSYAGDVDDNNTYWVRRTNTLYVGIDLATGAQTNLNLSGTIQGMADVAFFQDGADDYLVGFGGGRAGIIDLDTGVSRVTPVTGLPTSGSFGATWTDFNDRIFTFHNTTGQIFEVFDVFGANPYATLAAQGDPSGNNDGFSCIAAPFPNLPPLAFDDEFVTPLDTPVSENVLVDNGNGADNDPESGPLTVDTMPVSGPSNGTVILNADGTFTYTPSPGFFGVDTFVYQISDQTGLTATATVTITIEKADLSLSKSIANLTNDADSNGEVSEGDVVEFTITMTNDGNVTLNDVNVEDTLLTPSLETCATVAPGATCVLTGSYTVTAADVTAGSFDNTASVTSTEVAGPTDSNTVTTPINSPAMELAKAAPVLTTDADSNTEISEGDTVTYTVTLSNTGTAILSNVVVEDTLLSPSTETCATLAPGVDCVLTGTYVVTAADVTAGEIVNNATATSDQTPDAAASNTETLNAPAMALAKAAPVLTTDADSNTEISEGDTVTYTVTLSNTGTAILSNVFVEDTLLTPSTETCATLAPAVDCVLTGAYVVTAADVTAGEIVNNATANSDQTGEETASNTQPLLAPAMELAKAAPVLTTDADSNTEISEGDTVTYTVTLSNTGTAILSNVFVEDTLLTPSTETCATLAPGVDCVLTGTYVVTAADVTAGEIVNNATANSDQTGEETASNTQPLLAPAMKLAKAAPVLTTDGDSNAEISEGDTVTYTVTLSNTGTAILSNVVVEDTLLSPSTETCATLAPGADCVLTGNYVVSAADVTAGEIVNNATANSDQTPAAETASNTQPLNAPAMELAKAAPTLTTDADGNIEISEGDTVTYTVTLTNIGTMTLSNVVVEDTMLNPTSETCATVAPGATCELTGTYVVTAADVTAGEIVNNATANSDQVATEATATNTQPLTAPAMELAKAAPTLTTDADGNTEISEGDTVTYTVTLTNTGTMTLSNVIVEDTLLTPSTETCATVAPGATCVLTGTYVVTAANVTAGEIVNNATANSDQVATEATATNTQPLTAPAMELAKAAPTLTTDADGNTEISEGDTVTYTVTLTNTGTMTLSNVVVEDTLLTPSTETCATVAPGATCELTGTYVVTAADVTAGEIVNNATANSDQTDEATATNTAPLNMPAMELAKAAPVLTSDVDSNTEISEGDTVTYTITLTNTGTMTLSNIVVEDTLLTPSTETCATVAPGAACVLTGTYVVTAADVTAGEIVNNATANSDQTAEATASNTEPLNTPALEVVKPAPVNADEDGDGFVSAGDTLTYTVTMTNTGTATLTDVVVSDNLINPSSNTCATVAPGATCELIGTYVVTQADVDGGAIDNEATAGSAQTDPSTATNTVTIAPMPSMELAKVSVETNFTMVGDTIDYTYDVVNTGNVTITGLSVSDDKIATVSCPVTTLLPGESTTCTATYTVTQEDLDAGFVTNNASATGTPPAGTLVDPTDSETVLGTQSPALTTVKTAIDTDFAAVGDTIDYTYVVTNSGNVTITDPISVTDDKIASVTCPTLPVGGLAPLASITCTGTYTVTQADLDAGSVTNIASSTDGNATSPEVTETVTGTQSPAMTLDKVGVDTSYNAVGDIINYTYTVENTGNVLIADLVVTDDLIDTVTCNVSSVGNGDANLDPGEVVVCTANYTVTQADIDNGSVTNNASATGTPPGGTLTDPTDAETVNAEQLPELSMVKTAVETTYAAVGDTIDYEYVVENTGNVYVANLSVTDDKIADVTCDVTAIGNNDANLDPGESVTCTATYTVTQADIDAGSVTNNAEATGDPAGGTLTPAPATETVDATQTPAMTMVKTVTDEQFQLPGDVTTYAYEVTNSGNTTITDPITVTDNRIPSVTCPALPAGGLAPGASITCTGEYTVTQADLDIGSVTNIASATDGTTTSPTDSAIIPADQDPAMTIAKSANFTDFTTAGEVVTYDYTVSNTGNLTITTDIDVTDDKIGTFTCHTGNLVPGASHTCTANYTITQADVDAGSVTNQAFATSGPLVAPPVDVTVDGTRTPDMTFVKRATVADFTAAGDVLSYEFDVENTGNVTLTNVSIADSLTTVTCPQDTLLPAETMVCTASYTVTQADVDAGEVLNTATASATPPVGSGPVLEPTDSVTVDGVGVAGIDFTKTALDTSYAAVGDILNYDLVVENTGPITLSNVTVTDDLAAVSCPFTVLAPAQSMTCTASYTITQADIDAGSLTNNASVSSELPGGVAGPGGTDSAVVDAAPNPVLTLDKAPVDTTYAAPGDVLNYTYVVFNDGNVSINNIVVTDDLIPSLSCPATTLAPTESMTCTGLYTVTQDDIDNGSVTNVAGADGTPTQGILVPPTDTVTVDATQAPSLATVKTATTPDFDTVGDIVSYDYVVTNDGNTTITDPISVSDDKIASVNCPALPMGGLLPTQSITCTATYVVTQADIDAGNITNIASATDGNVTSPTTTETVDGVQNPSMAMTKTGSPQTYSSVGETVTYTYVVTNTGNVTLTDAITIADDKIASVICPALPADGLAPGAMHTCTAEYTVTQADLDAGSVTNTASATSGSTTSPNVEETVNAEQTPSLGMDKVALTTDFTNVGDVLDYEYVVTNTGNVTITDAISVSDDKIASVSCPALPADGLAPSASITCTASYTVTQADIDAGDVVNVASATDGNIVSPTDTATIPAVQAPALDMVKTATTADFTNVGDIVSYDYVVTNTGNTTLTGGITVSDDKISSVVCPSLPMAGLAPTESITCTANYVVTQADIDAGSVTNVASASNGTDGPTSPTATETVDAVQAPALTIVKDSSTVTFDMPGDVVSYTYEVINSGNTTITDPISVTDDKIASVSCPALPVGGLAPMDSITCTADYTVTQADVDAGDVVNVASATDGNVVSPVDTRTVVATQTPEMTVVKTATDIQFTLPGDVTTYEYVVTNTGNTTLTDPITVSDNRIPSVSCPALPAGGLAPGASLTCTGTYTATQDDLDQGSVTNIATGSSGSLTSAPTSETIPANASPALEIIKTSPDTSYAMVGDVLTYNFEVTNTGNITLTGETTVVDDKIGTIVCFDGNIVPTGTVTCSADYVVTQADIDNGFVTNNAYADNTRATSAPVDLTINANQMPELTMVKTAQDASYASVGDVLDYTFEVTNSGNTTIVFPITVSDSRIADVMCPDLPAGGLAPNASITCTGSDTVTQADLDAGGVTNTATATDGVTTSNTGSQTVPADQNPALGMVKTALDSDFVNVGDVLDYSYVVTNAGNVTITDAITVSDSRIPSVTCPALPAGGLVPGASITCTGSDTVTQADLDAGMVENTASATDGNVTSPVDNAVVEGTQSPALTTVKTALDTSFNAAGDVLSYEYIVTNTGNVTLTDPVSVSDDRIASVSCPALPAGGLIPGASITCSADYTVTQADVDAGSVTNLASSTDGNVTSPEVSETVNGEQTPALETVKTANETTFAAVGDTLTYNYVVTNVGNVTITNAVTVSDDRIATVVCPDLPAGGLTPGASITCTGTDTVTQADLDGGSVTNLASATDGSVTSPEVSETVEGTQTPDFTVNKVAVSNNFTTPGDILSYEYIITNTGNVTLTEQASVSDDKIASVTCPTMPIGGLVPGASITCTADYTVTQADIDAGSVTNIASATIGSQTSPTDTVTIDGTQAPALTIDKSTTSTDFTMAGEVISYSYVVTNSGNTTITNAISVSDDKIADVTCPALPADGLAPSASITCTADYTVTQADVDAGEVTNIASSSAGSIVSPDDSVTVTGTQTPAMSVAKTATTETFAMPGDIVSYEYVVTNTGNVTITDAITVSDDKIASVSCPALPAGGLAPSASMTCTADYEATQADIDAGSVTNIASASAGDLSSPEATETVDATIEPRLSITKEASEMVQAFGPLYDVTYTINVENTGNVTLNDFQVTDDMATMLAPATMYNTPAVTVADINGATANTDYNGTTDVNLLSGTPMMNVGDSGTVTINVRIDTTNGTPAQANVATSSFAEMTEPVPSNPAVIDTTDTDGDGTPDNLESVTEDRDGDGIVDSEDYDPTGYFYCEENGQILTGGGISITGPNGTNSAIGAANDIVIVQDGSNGFYQFYVTQAGTYTLTPTYPTSGAPSTDRLVEGGALDVTSLLPNNPGILGSGEFGDTGRLADHSAETNSPFYFEFDIEAGDPSVFMNNIPLQHCGRTELSMNKTVIGEPVVQSDGSQVITYAFEVTNSGETQVDNIQLTDDLGSVYGDANVIVNSNEITVEPVGFTGDENASYDGVFDVNLLDGLGTLEAGEVLTVQVQTTVTPQEASTYINKASVSAENPLTGTPITPVDATAAVELIPAAKVQDLIVRKSARPNTVQIGDPVLYTIEVTNNGIGNISDIEIVDNIPAGFAYVPNSATLSDATTTVKVEPSVPSTNNLVWTMDDMQAAPLDFLAPGETISVNLRLLAGPNVQFGAHENQAYAANTETGERSAIATASVDYIPEPTFDCTPVIGRVYDDVNHNGYPDDGEPGLPGVRLVTVNGDIITTDHFGRYHIPCAIIADSEHGSNFLLKTDVRTLPLGFTPTTENPRVVRATRGKFVKLNFGAAYRPKLRMDIYAADFDRGLLTQEAAGRIKSVMSTAQTAERALVVYHAADEQDVTQAQANLTLAMKVIEELAPRTLKDIALEASWDDQVMDADGAHGVRYASKAMTRDETKRIQFVSDYRGGLKSDHSVKPALRGGKGSKALAGDDRDKNVRIYGRQDHVEEQSARPARVQRWVGWADTMSSYAEGPEIETTVDSLDPVKRLNAQANVVAQPEGRMIMAEAYHNYQAFTEKLEVRLFDADRSVRGEPLAILPVRDGYGSVAVNNAWPEDLVYVLRAYGKDGDFDETAPKTLRVGDAEHDLTPEGWSAESYTAFGQNTLVKDNVTIRGGAVRVFGRNINAEEVGIMGQRVRVDESGRFVAEQLLPAGQQQIELWLPGTEAGVNRVVRMVDVKSRDTFFVGQAEATIGQRQSDADTFTEGRLAFYVRSRLNDRWSITATADTGEAPIEDLLKGLDDKDVTQLLRRLDPDRYYPVYGDDSTIEQDAPTSGRIYARIERDDDYLLWGNYQTNFNDTEFARIQRTLYGAKFHWDENEATRYGDARTEVTAFLAEGGTRQGRDELRGTGGSVYYLRHGDVSIGSEILRIETRDVVSGLVLESRRLTYGTDYDMDFIQGRIILNRPLSSSSNDGRLFRDGSNSGHEEVLVADYEFSPVAGSDDAMIYGARGSRWFGDILKFGATYNHGENGGAESDLLEADLTLQLAAGTYIKGEIAQSKGEGVQTYRSIDGGFSFAATDRGGQSGLNQDNEAMAYAVEAATDMEDFFDADGRIHAYWRKREAGFAGLSESTNQDIEQYGGGIRLNVFDGLSVAARADVIEDNNIGSNSFAEGSIEYALNDNVKLAAGVSYNDDGRGNEGTAVGARAEYAFNDDSKVYVFGQAGLDGDNRRTTDRAGVGGEWRLSQHLFLGGEVSGGEDGLGARVSARYHEEDGDEYYLAYDLPLNSQVASNMGTFNLGARHRFSDALSVYGEERFQFNDRGLAGMTHAYGVDYKPGNWRLGLSGELGNVEDLDRRALSASVGFNDDRMQAGVTTEFREDENTLTGDIRRTWLLRSTALYQMNDELRLQGKLNWAHSDQPSGTGVVDDFLSAEFTEASLAAAYRPIWDDRLNVLAKATYLYDLSPTSQRFNGEAVDFRQKSSIYSVDASYDFHPRWTLGAKYGHRSGYVTDGRESEDFYKSSADLGVIRLDYHLTHRWDATLEGRYLDIGNGTITREGGLAMLYRHINDNAKIGVGLTYGGIDQEYLLANDDKDVGWLVNVVGKF